jgi:uncharacterized protein
MEAILELPPKVKNSWWSLFHYLLLLILFVFLFYIPIVIFFPEFFQGTSEEFSNVWHDRPWFQIASQLTFLVAALTATYVVVVILEKSTFRSFGLTAHLKALGNGFFLGTSTMAIFVLFSYSLGFVDFSFNTFSVHLLESFFLYFLVAVAEEVIIRGYVLFKFRSKISEFPALLVSSILFGLMHWGNDHFTWIGFVNISLSGFLMGLLIFRTNTISSAVGIHWAWNFIQGSIFGFGVSGHKEIGIFTPQFIESSFLTGGEFGAEGSVILIPITLLLILLIYRFSSKKLKTTIS